MGNTPKLWGAPNLGRGLTCHLGVLRDRGGSSGAERLQKRGGRFGGPPVQLGDPHSKFRAPPAYLTTWLLSCRRGWGVTGRERGKFGGIPMSKEGMGRGFKVWKTPLKIWGGPYLTVWGRDGGCCCGCSSASLGRAVGRFGGQFWGGGAVWG